MKVETLTVSEEEQQVIESAIEYYLQAHNGLYRDVAPAKEALFQATEKLLNEHEGRWPG